MRVPGNEGKVRRSLSDEDEMPIALVARIAAFGVNILLVAGGIALAIWQSLEKANAVALYEAAGGYANNDVTRGYYIGIVGGLGISLLAVMALMGVQKGNRWGCWIDVLIWLVMWLPASIGLSMYHEDGFAIASLVCSMGIILAIATHQLLKESRQGKSSHRPNVTSR